MTLPVVDSSVSLRLSVTEACPLRCLYCVPAQGFEREARRRLTSEEIRSFVCFLSETYGLRKVRLTGGEPLLRPDLEALTSVLSSCGIPDIALTSNGQDLARRAAGLQKAGLRRVNVSLDSLDPEMFTRLTGRGSLAYTLAGLEAARDAGLAPIRVNTVVMRGLNDREAPSLLDYCLARGFELRFLEVMPIGAMRDSFETFFVSSDETIKSLSSEFKLTAIAPTGTARNFEVQNQEGLRGRVGFISPMSQPFCSRCRRLRLTASGDLIGCLGKPSRVAIREHLRQPGSQLVELVGRALSLKRTTESFQGEPSMAAIGG